MGEFEGPPAGGAATETRMEIVTNKYWSAQGNSIADALAEGVDISVQCIATNGDDIAGRVRLINLEVWFKKTEFFDAPLVIQDNPCTSLLTTRTRRARRTWRSLHSICDFRRIDQFCGKFIDNFEELLLREM